MRNYLTLLLGVIVLASSVVSDADGGIFGRRGKRRCARKAPSCCQKLCGTGEHSPRSCTGKTCLLYPVYTFNNGMGQSETVYSAMKCGSMMVYYNDPNPDLCINNGCPGCVNPCNTNCFTRLKDAHDLCDKGLIAYADPDTAPMPHATSGPHFHHIRDQQGTHKFVWWEFRHEGHRLRLGFEIAPSSTVVSWPAINPRPKGNFCYTFKANVSGPRVNVILKGP